MVNLEPEYIPISFPNMIADFETHGVALGGMIGTSPEALNSYFVKKGYETEMIVGENINNDSLDSLDQNYDAYYLLREDGIYQCDMDGDNEKRICDTVSNSILFEDHGGHLFIYNTFGNEKLVTII